MDAVNFLKAYNRMCDNYGGTCIACSLEEECCDLINEDCNFEKVVSVVEKWAKEHPVKTRQSKFLEQFPAADVVSTYQYEEIKAKYEALKKLIDGEWVDCHSVQDALGIDFSTGMHRFDFSREVEWNRLPLNGQKITTKFRLKQKD